MQVLKFYSRQILLTFAISRTFLPLTIAKLSTIKNGPVFLVHPVLFIKIAIDQPWRPAHVLKKGKKEQKESHKQ